MYRRNRAFDGHVLVSQAQTNLTTCYSLLGRHTEVIRMRRQIYATRQRQLGSQNPSTLIAGGCLGSDLVGDGHWAEGRSILGSILPDCRSVLGPDHETTFKCEIMYGKAAFWDTTCDEDALAMLEAIEARARRVFGASHGLVLASQEIVREVRTGKKGRRSVFI